MVASEKKRRTRKQSKKRAARSSIAANAMVMSEGDAARRLGVSVRTLQRWRITGRGPAFCKLGRLVGYTNEDLGGFVDSHRKTSTSVQSAA